MLLKIENMTCGGCAKSVTKAIQSERYGQAGPRRSHGQGRDGGDHRRYRTRSGRSRLSCGRDLMRMKR